MKAHTSISISTCQNETTFSSHRIFISYQKGRAQNEELLVTTGRRKDLICQHSFFNEEEIMLHNFRERWMGIIWEEG
jgi:hypothetical protein